MSEPSGYLSKREMTDEMRDWITTYQCLIAMGKWAELVEHIRANVNLSKEVLLSVDPAVQEATHRT